MKTSEHQQLFVRHIVLLIQYAHIKGYEITFGDFYRSPSVHGEYGVKKSYSAGKSEHKRRLAADLNLFKDGKYLTTTEDHKVLGEFWESLDPLNRWGGNWDDGNHYERYIG